MLQIRLHRTGRTKRPHFRVVVAEHRRAAQGPYVSALGIWDPIAGKLNIDEKALTTWMDRGAKPSDRISRLLKKHGMKHKHIRIHERPARGPKKLEPKPEPAEKVASSEQANVEVETPKETVEVAAGEKPAAPVAEPEVGNEPKTTKEQAKTSASEAQAEPVDSAKPEANTAQAEGEERAKSPTGDQA